MSPQRQQRRAARWFVAMALAVGALILSVWLVGAKAASDIRASELKARTEQAARVERARIIQTASVRAGCARGVARDFEAWETNRDLYRFAQAAANVWRSDGRLVVARRYQSTADHARFRMARIRLRLPNREDAATVRAFCVTLYPDPAKG
jgi:hypothetical protein